MKIVAIIGTIVLMIGIICIYDARQITKKIFSFGDQNEAVFALKITGFIISIIGRIINYAIKKGLVFLWSKKSY